MSPDLPGKACADRATKTAQCFCTLKSGCEVSISEILPDPHFQSRPTVKSLVGAAGYQVQLVEGGKWLFMAVGKMVGYGNA